jgi:hypothetical protein
LRAGERFPAEVAEKVFPRMVRWQEQYNLHQTRVVYGNGAQNGWAELSGTKTLEEWNRHWGLARSDALIGRPKFVGGNVAAKLSVRPEQVTARDFRLADDSPGKGAGPGGKDLGADVDLVGPGPAYERWKQTPDYRQWLRETGQKQ